MITSKQRAYLRGLATSESAIMQVGKGGIGENLIKTVSDALEARELIKLSVLENSSEDVREAAETLADGTGGVCAGGTSLLFVGEPRSCGLCLEIRCCS